MKGKNQLLIQVKKRPKYFTSIKEKLKFIKLKMLKFMLRVLFLEKSSMSIEERYKRVFMLVINFFAIVASAWFTVNDFISLSEDYTYFINHIVSTIFFFIAFVFYFLTCNRFFQIYVLLMAITLQFTYLFMFFAIFDSDIHMAHDTVSFVGIAFLVSLWVGNRFNQFITLTIWIGQIAYILAKEPFVTDYYKGGYEDDDSIFYKLFKAVRILMCPILAPFVATIMLEFYQKFKRSNERTLFQIVKSVANLDFSSEIVTNLMKKNEYSLTEIEKLVKIIIQNLTFYRSFLPEEIIEQDETDESDHTLTSENNSTYSYESDPKTENSTVASVASVESQQPHKRFRKRKKKKKSDFYRDMKELNFERKKHSIEKKIFTGVLLSFFPTFDDLICNTIALKKQNVSPAKDTKKIDEDSINSKLSKFFEQFLERISFITKQYGGIIHSFDHSGILIGFNSSRKVMNEEIKACEAAFSIKQIFMDIKKKEIEENKSILIKEILQPFLLNISVCCDEFQLGNFGSSGFQRFQLYGVGNKILQILNDRHNWNPEKYETKTTKYRDFFPGKILVCDDVLSAVKFKFRSKKIDRLGIYSKHGEEISRKVIHYLTAKIKISENKEWMYTLQSQKPNWDGESDDEETLNYNELIQELFEKSEDEINWGKCKEITGKLSKSSEDENFISFMFEKIKVKCSLSKYH